MLKNIKIQNLYGKNYNISFNQDLTLLVGKNGSGKTTVLNLINLIISGQITKICEYKFDNLELSFYKNKNLFIVNRIEDSYVIKYKDKIVYLEEKKEKVFFVTDYDNLDEERISHVNKKNLGHEDTVKMISVDDSSNNNLNFIKKEFRDIFEFVYVPLNRKVSWISNNIWTRRNQNKDYVDSVQVAEKYLVNYKSFIKNIEQRKNEATKEKMIDIFSEPMDFNFKRLYTVDKVEEFRVLYKQEFDEKIVKTIDKLFKQYEKNKRDLEEGITKRNPDDDDDVNKFINYQLSLIQLYKINEIRNYIKEEFDWLQKMKSNFELILANINNLFKDTGKKLFFNVDTNSLYFKNNRDKKELEITHLSSGEKQLLMFYIFSMASFSNKKNSSSVVLFDEPELSLHIEWQEKLLSSIEKKNVQKQIIIATHSPDLIGEYVAKCVEVVGIS